MKKTAIIGASPNSSRYSYLAGHRLKAKGHAIVPLGIRGGVIADEDILTDWPESIEGLDTITMYVGPQRQPQYYDYILGLQPKRIIFNPGTENMELEKLAHEKGIETLEACTLVMLSNGLY